MRTLACAEPAADNTAPVPAAAPNAATHGYKLLVVDDEPGIRDVLETILASRGYLVTSVTNGLEALDCLKREHFDLIISDMCMPEMDGERLYETVREKNPKLRKPTTREGWARLAYDIGLKVIHVAERDTQIANIAKRMDEAIRSGHGHDDFAAVGAEGLTS